ncbi:MAG: GPW/gp25 family protein [Moorea sp. SIO2B7]|nr:GPW/gp25 family protein [Moorena sp. SIO2B7]
MPEISNNQQEDYIGAGLAFPIRVNLQSNLKLTFDISNIEESIRIILGTKLGERVYRPDFGCRLDELVFAPMNTETLLLIRIYVQEALEKWEPRIILDGVYTEPDPFEGRLDIIIQYHPKDSYDYRSLVYPFYLQPTG